MSDSPKRFDDVIDMLTHDCHKYALEVARLKAERVHDLNQIGGLQQELARLRASSFVTAVPVEQYERVVKAGDAIIMITSQYVTDSTLRNLALRDWNAAKEGKPSV